MSGLDALPEWAAILVAARRGLITDRTAGDHVAAIDEKLLASSAGEHAPEDVR